MLPPATVGVNPRGGEVDRDVLLDDFIDRLTAELDSATGNPMGRVGGLIDLGSATGSRTDERAPMPMERLNAGWRLGRPVGLGVDGEPTLELSAAPGMTLFETLEQSDLPDEATFVVQRRALVFAVLNISPYSPGHVMVLPKRAVPDLLELGEDEERELWRLVRDVYRAVRKAFSPDGMNVGINDGVAGGASQPDHLHVHVVPRWNADTSFTTTVADVRVLPMTLHDAWTRVRAALADPDHLTPRPVGGAPASDAPAKPDH